MSQPRGAVANSFAPEIMQSETREETEMIESMLTNNKAHLLYDALGDQEEPIQMMDVEEQERIKTVYTLFEYLKKEYLDGMRLEYSEVYDTFRDRVAPLLPELEQDRAVVEELIDTFLSRMVLNLITQDKVAFKVQDDMIHALEELYDHRERPIIVDRSTNGAKENKKKKKEKEPVYQVKNDFPHYDRRNKEISERCIAHANPLTDEIEIHFSKAKKRGRHQKIRNEMIINSVEAMAGELIEKRQSLSHAHTQSSKACANSPSSSSLSNSPSSPPPISGTQGQQGQKANGIDHYPIFKETLDIFNRCIPKTNNHGFYIQRLILFIRTLDSKVWPLHGLMSLANNMNYCVKAETVKLKFDRTVKRFYSCFSGIELQDGQEVTCLKVVENDAVRLKEWRDNPPINRKPFETPEFTRSIGVFYLEKNLCCPSTLFFTTFSDSYKAKFPEVFDGTNASLVSLKTEPKPQKKRKASLLQSEPSTNNKKAKTVVLSDVKCEDSSLFDSLIPFATKTRPSMLRVMMMHIDSVLETHLSKDTQRTVWYAYRHPEEKYKRNYADEKEQMIGLLEKMTKKSFHVDIKQLAFYAIVSSPALSMIEEGEAQIKLTDVCIEAILDFVEALVVPERKFSDFAATQKTRMMRAISHHTQERIKRRGLGIVNPFLISNSVKRDVGDATTKLETIHWFRCCPLLFIILFAHLAKEDASGLLRQPNTEAYDFKPLFKALQLTLK